MAPVPPAGPDEAATRAYVQAQGQMGSQAQQAPSIATAPEAMQTAMARSAGINAPSQFNATQVATIQNPFTRGDAQLAANNAGAGGVLGAISGSTRDYLQQAAGGLDLQKEITRRAVQQMLDQHKFDAESLQVQRESNKTKLEQIAYDREQQRLENDPTTPEGKRKLAKQQLEDAQIAASLSELGKQKGPSTAKAVSAQTGIPVTKITDAEKSRFYLDNAATLFDQVSKANGTPEQLSASIQDELQKVWGAYNNPSLSHDVRQKALDSLGGMDLQTLHDVIFNQYAPMLTGYEAAPPYVAPAAATQAAMQAGAGLPAVQTPYSAIGAQQPYGAQQTVIPTQSAPTSSSDLKRMLWGAGQGAAAPPVAAVPVVSPQVQAHLNEQANIAAAEKAGILTPQTVSMSETDAKNFVKASTKLPKGKTKNTKK